MNKVKRNELKSIARRFSLYRWLRRRLPETHRYTLEDEIRHVQEAPPLTFDWPSGVPKPMVGLVKEYGERLNDKLYWTKYERFLKHNHIPYVYLDIHRSTFLEQAESSDVILWRTLSDPASRWEAETKIRILQKERGKLCLPSEEELWFYEEKIRQYYLMKVNDLPVINTFITHSKDEALTFIRNCRYPLVSKTAIGSGSLGVRLVKDYRQAKRMCDRVFENGHITYWPYLKQKNYVYFQEFIQDAAYDLRVIVVGNSFVGYYRNIPKGDFRASGHGNEQLEKKAIPREALFLAQKAKEALPKTRILAIDMLYSARDSQYYISETSIFTAVYTPALLKVDGIPGRYVCENGEFHFQEGKYWIQELALMELFNEWIAANRE